jgi:hypothetical protein
MARQIDNTYATLARSGEAADGGISEDYLRAAREQVEEALESGEIEPERRDFFAAMHLLQAGDIDGAILGFRRAARSSTAPFDALSTVSLGECQRVRGREAAAIREWKRVASSEDAAPATRSVAWLSLAALAERRQDPRLAAKADAGLKDLDDLDEPSEIAGPGQFQR